MCLLEKVRQQNRCDNSYGFYYFGCQSVLVCMTSIKLMTKMGKSVFFLTSVKKVQASNAVQDFKDKDFISQKPKDTTGRFTGLPPANRE